MSEVPATASGALRFVVYSDWLCPWCYLGAARLWQLEERHPGQVELEWRSYLLRPHPSAEPRDPQKFRTYTQRWQQIASEPDAPVFRAWSGDAPAPSYSLPPQVVAKAAAALGDASYRALQRRLFAAYFAESRDISDEATLRSIWNESGLPDAAFPAQSDPELVARVLADHRQAQQEGATGVPAVRRADDDLVIVGAQPLAFYEKWLRRTREERRAEA